MAGAAAVTPSSNGSTAKHIGVVSYFHPPFPGAGGNRWDAMAHYLREDGYRVTVIACDAWGVLPDDAMLGVRRVRDLRSVKLFRRTLRRRELMATASGPTVVEQPPTALLTKVVPPDLHLISWIPNAFLNLRQLQDNDPLHCLVTSGPPASVHALGLLLGGARPAWVIDFRDGWRFQDGRPAFPTAPQRKFDAWMERKACQTAEITVGATAPIADDLQRRLGARSVVIPNAYDPRVSPTEAQISEKRFDRGAVTLVLTGTLSGVRGSDPRPLLEALRQVNAMSGKPVRLMHAGRLTSEEQKMVTESGIGAAFQHVGTLPRREAIAMQRAGDALVLLTSKHSSESTSKIFEYLAARRPIIALAADNEAARIVEATGTGITVAPDDTAAIVEALCRSVTGELAAAYAPRGLERYTYPAPAEKMSEVIQAAVGLHQRSKARR